MNDLTLIFITAGERPQKWAKFHAEHLSMLPYPMITMRDEKKMGEQMIYQRLLEGAKQATTPYIAVVEDDVLYHPDHFKYRPDADTFSYNQNRWAIFTWDNGMMYSWRNRKSNCSLIAPRELAIEALEERFALNPNAWPWVGELGRHNVERRLGVTLRKSVEWFSKIAVIQFNHDGSSEERQGRHRKEHGVMRAYDMPHWGKSSDLIKHYA
jgi:hypothetical protein